MGDYSIITYLNIFVLDFFKQVVISISFPANAHFYTTLEPLDEISFYPLSNIGTRVNQIIGWRNFSIIVQLYIFI